MIGLLGRVCLLGVCLLLAGCSESSFDEGNVQGVFAARPIRLDGEQVVMSFEQFECGVTSELWDSEPVGPDLRIGRLTQKARDLQFADDVRLEGERRPSAQLRGEFRVLVRTVKSIHEEGPNAKLIEAVVNPVLNHACFGEQNPVYLMGVRKGDFSIDVAPRFEFRHNGDWQVDRILH